MADNIGVLGEPSMIVGTMHGFSFSRIAIERRKGSGTTLTFCRKSIPSTILKSSMGATMKSIFPSQERMCIVTPRATSCDGLAVELTALSQPPSLDAWSSSLFALSFETKL